MANITLLGQDFLNVPSAEFPQTGGGTVVFSEGGGGGIPCPAGFTYYNGYLLPTIPTVPGYSYVWIRENPGTDTFDAVYGDGVWYSRSGTGTLDNWALTFNNQSSNQSRFYTCPRTNPTEWTQGTSSSNYYGTTNGRKVIWTNKDIHIASAGGNVLLQKGTALTVS